MSEKPIFLTQEGLAKLDEELEHLLTVRRQQVADQIHRAKELGGTANNAEYDDAKNEQGFVEGRILTLEHIVKNATVISKDQAPSEWVKLGCKVTLLNQEGTEEHFSIVGSAEANPREGRISNESPVGRTLLGKRIGEAVQVMVPAGVLTFTVIAIE